MSAPTTVVSVRNVDINNMSFVAGPSKAGRNPSITLKYNGQNLQLRLPNKLPCRLMTREGENGVTTYTLTLTLKGCDPYARERSSDSDDIGKFYNFLLDLEEKIIQSAIENSPKWFGKKRSEEAIRDAFKKIINVSADKIDGEYVPNGKYPPSIRVKIPVYDNKVTIDKEGIIDNTGNPIYVSPDTLSAIFPNYSDVNLMVTGSVYVIAGGGFGVTWRMRAAQVFPQARVNAASIFADVEEDESPKEATESSGPVEVSSDAPAATAPARRRRAAPSAH